MHITRKNLDEIEIADLQTLVDARARETEVLEFKSMLPFKPTKGQPQTADRWIERGDAVGNEARDEILAEIVAFANANGGTLVLGVQESSEQPREAVGLARLPRCEDLARRLLDAAEDIVEPRLSALAGRGLPIDDTGQGYVVMRVGRSRFGPHRVNGRSARDFYVRRGERAARMDVREIKNLTLELARSDERLEAILNERRGLAAQRYKALPPRPDAEHVPPILVRATALPTLSENIDGLTTRRDLWWFGGPFDLNTGEAKPYGCAYPARDFGDPPRVQLRSLVREDPGLARIVRGDGLVEFVFAREARRISENPAQARLYVGWLMSLVVGAMAQVQHLRQHLGWDAVEFGMEAEIISAGPLRLMWNDNDWDNRHSRPDALPLRLPLYSIRGIETFDALIGQILLDLHNAWGDSWPGQASINWGKLVK